MTKYLAGVDKTIPVDIAYPSIEGKPIVYMTEEELKNLSADAIGELADEIIRLRGEQDYR